MIMEMRKQLLAFVRMFLPSVGFVCTCIGAYLVSQQTGRGYGLMAVYIMIILGFLAMLLGMFWTLCHNMRSKMYQRRMDERNIQVFTIERPSSFPPSYEESQTQHELSEVRVAVDLADDRMNLAPPLYSQDSSQAPDCTWSWELPPPYAQAVQAGPGNEQRELEAPH